MQYNLIESNEHTNNYIYVGLVYSEKKWKPYYTRALADFNFDEQVKVGSIIYVYVLVDWNYYIIDKG